MKGNHVNHDEQINRLHEALQAQRRTLEANLAACEQRERELAEVAGSTGPCASQALKRLTQRVGLTYSAIKGLEDCTTVNAVGSL